MAATCHTRCVATRHRACKRSAVLGAVNASSLRSDRAAARLRALTAPAPSASVSAYAAAGRHVAAQRWKVKRAVRFTAFRRPAFCIRLSGGRPADQSNALTRGRVRVTFVDGVLQRVDIAGVDDEGFVHSGPDGANPRGYWTPFESVTRVEAVGSRDLRMTDMARDLFAWQ